MCKHTHATLLQRHTIAYNPTLAAALYTKSAVSNPELFAALFPSINVGELCPTSKVVMKNR